ncbi:MAG: hypothetical protein NTZ43_13240 [Gemmatimonadetes bacterium]|nr:hypothetical protein [Gemmatimonadota bacterium]
MRLLAYLDALVAAVRARDAAEITRLLAHPLARMLSREVAAEARAAVIATPALAPLRLLQLRHQTAMLLGASSTDASVDARSAVVPPSAARTADRRAPARHQMELPLSA